MIMHIEAATEADLQALTKPLAVLLEQEAEFMPNPEAQCRGFLRTITNRDVGIVLVAKEGKMVLGMVILLYTISTALGERVALLEDMVVGTKALGVGYHLLQRAVAVAEAAGCLRITLLTDQQSLSAQRFCKWHGFAPSSMDPMRLHLAASQS